jgi:hypothetical protein
MKKFVSKMCSCQEKSTRLLLTLLVLACLGTQLATAQPLQSPPKTEAVAAGEEKSVVDEVDARKFLSHCLAAGVGESTFSEAKLIEFVRGNSELILAAPHGGRLAPADFPIRTSTNAVTASDWNTDHLARSIWREIGRDGQRIPHLIICHVQRKFVDANRPIDAACPVNSPARVVWMDYQDAISAAKEDVIQSLGRGLFVELHGHGHPEERLELGYLLRSKDYDLPQAEFQALATKSSLREVTERGNVNLDELLRGSQSLGFYLAKQGIASMPSPEFPSPGALPYFNGGWNTLTHSSRDAGTISSVQIECHRNGVRDTRAEVAASSKKIAPALLEFLNAHYPRSE